MLQKKSTKIKSYQKRTVLDNFLWFVENYLPQKNKKSLVEDYPLEKLESDTINKIKKLATDRSKSLRGDSYNSTIIFTVGSWALPYLNFLKTIRLIK